MRKFKYFLIQNDPGVMQLYVTYKDYDLFCSKENNLACLYEADEVLGCKA